MRNKTINVTGQKVEMIQDLMKNDTKALIYLDPPYYPTAKTKDGKISPYKLYNGDYLPVDFLKLKLRCDELTASEIPFVLSNSASEFIRVLFKDYIIVDIDEVRAMQQGKGKGSRPPKNCLLITNFRQKKDFMNGIVQMNKINKLAVKEG